MYRHALLLVGTLTMTFALSTARAQTASQDGEADPVSLVCVETDSGGFKWRDEKANFQKLDPSRYLVRVISETERTVDPSRYLVRVISETERTVKSGERERERKLRCRRATELLTLCRWGFETWVFKGEESFTLSYIHGGVIGGSSNIYVSYGECQKP